MQLASAQTEIDNAEPNGLVALEAGDYGPIVIGKPLTLACDGACFWADGSVPSVRIDASNVCLQNATLRSLGTARDRSFPVVLEIAANAFATFQSVKLCGAVKGLAGESDLWLLPHFLNLGELESQESYFIIELAVPISCQLISRVAGIDFDPAALVPGINKVKMRVRDVSQDSLLVGNVELITSQLTRLIPLYGRVLKFSASNVNIVSSLSKLTEQEQERFLASRLPPVQPTTTPAEPQVEPLLTKPTPDDSSSEAKARGAEAKAVKERGPSIPQQPIVGQPLVTREPAVAKQTPWAPVAGSNAEAFRPQPQQALSSLFDGLPVEVEKPDAAPPLSPPPTGGGLVGALFTGSTERSKGEVPESPGAKPDAAEQEKEEKPAKLSAPIISSLFTKEGD